MRMPNVTPSKVLLVPRPDPARLSVVVPLFNEEEVVPALRERLTAVADALPMTVEIVLVDDGSSDGGLELLAEWAAADPRVRVLALARNFGHQAAATAGLDAARGDAVVLMDADLQDPPELIPEMLASYREGWDVVIGRRLRRPGESLWKRATAFLFYRLMRFLIFERLPADAGDFRLISRPCLDAVRSMRETHRFLRGMVAWVGFPQTEVRYERSARQAGTTKYPLSRMLAFAWTAAVSFSARPLRLSFAFAFFAIVAAVGVAAYAFFRALLGYYVVHGWASLMVTTCLIGTAVLIGIGLIGEYLGRVFEAVKQRPLYVVARTLGERQDGEPGRGGGGRPA